MQLGGIGDSHSAEAHRVTKCLHSHEHALEGNMKLSSPGLSQEKVMAAHHSQEAQAAPASLLDQLRQLLRSVKTGVLNVWQGGKPLAAREQKGRADAGQTTEAEREAAVAVAQKSRERLLPNPYFAAVEPQKRQSIELPVLQSAKNKVKAVAGRLAKHLPGFFSSFQKRDSFQSGKEGNREDLRKRSKYREDKLEIDCILTDESYLLDSYDRKGAYSQLTTRK